MFRRLLMFSILLHIAQFSWSQNDYCTKVFQVLYDVQKNACSASDQFPAQENCNVFVGKAVNEIYGITDFISNTSPSDYYIANDIVDLLFTSLSAKWELIGTCDQQETLTKAQSIANSNRCVIAVWKNPNPSPKAHGHVCLLLPGTLKLGWKDMQVPNAANFSQGNPNLNFVCDKLSGAFGREKRNAVFLFVHKD